MRIKIENMLPGVEHQIQIRSVSGSNYSEWSKTFTLTPPGDQVAPYPPQNLAVQIDGTSFKASWDEVTQSEDGSAASDLAKYRVYVSDGSTTVNFDVVGASFDFPFEVNTSAFGSPQGSLDFYVTAIDTTGNESVHSSTVHASNPAPGAPVNIQASGIQDGISLSWDSPSDDDIKGYNVYVGTSAGFTPNSGNLLRFTNTTAVIHSTLNYATEYYYKVFSVDVFNTPSVTSADAGPASPKSSFAVDVDAPENATGLSATLLDERTAKVSWNASANSDNDLAGYIIGYAKSGTTDFSFITADAEQTEAVVNNLSAYIDYDFKIRSYDWSANNSAWSGVYTLGGAVNSAPEKPAVPTAATSVMRIQVSVSGLDSTGQPMDDDVEYYEVHASTQNGFVASEFYDAWNYSYWSCYGWVISGSCRW